jgi:hypothetical protein
MVGNAFLPPPNGAQMVVFIKAAGVVMVAAVGIVETVNLISRGWCGPGKLLAVPSCPAARIVFIKVRREQMLSRPSVVQAPYLSSTGSIRTVRYCQHDQERKHQSTCKPGQNRCSTVPFLLRSHFSSLGQELPSLHFVIRSGSLNIF